MFAVRGYNLVCAALLEDAIEGVLPEDTRALAVRMAQVERARGDSRQEGREWVMCHGEGYVHSTSPQVNLWGALCPQHITTS
eukprot:2013260-Rhodomonas_salina.1